MIAYTFSLMIRGFLRSKSTLLINLAGLTVAFSSVLIIYLWAKDEMSVDKFHKNDNRLFQVVSNVTSNGIASMREPTPIGLAHVLSAELPEVEFASTVTPPKWFPKIVVTEKNLKVKCEGKFVSRDFLKMFSYSLAAGNAETGLASKHSILVSATLAVKLFGSEGAALGRSLTWELTDIKRDGIIEGVFNDIPVNSTDQFDIVFPIDMLRDIMGFSEDDMAAFGPHTFITIPEGADITNVTRKIDQLIKLKRPDLKPDTFYLVKYSSRYLYGNFDNGIQGAGRIKYVKLFSWVGLAILLLACINLINLSTAANIARLKEVGVQKIIGASRRWLAWRSIAEAGVLCLVSFLLAVVVVSFLIPSVNLVLEKQLSLPSDISTLATGLLIAIVIGVSIGLYPALYLTGINPLHALRKNTHFGFRSAFARQALVGFQCAISVLAIFITLVIHSQITFLKNTSLGYQKENVIYFENEGAIANDPNSFIASLKEIPGVVNASSMIGSFTGMAVPPQAVAIDGKQIPLQLSFVNYDLIETMGIEISSGRSFKKELNDTDKIVINERALAVLGLTDAVGKTIPFGGRQLEIIGVVKDFHLGSLHQQIHPAIFQLETDKHWNIVVRLEQNNRIATLSRIANHVEQVNPGLPFEFRFLEDELNRQYKSEQRIGFLASSFSVITVFISLLGLFSLASFICQRRTKEIGIRKAVGASTHEITVMLLAFFLRILFVSTLIAFPVGLLAAEGWLSTFAYAISIQAWMIFVTGGTAIILMLGAIGGFIFRAANTSPSLTLKSE